LAFACSFSVHNFHPWWSNLWLTQNFPAGCYLTSQSRSLWRDIIQKAVAGGMNSISIYSMPGMQNPSPGVLDFDGLRDLEHAFKEAKEAGLWVVPRPGPYVNAEVTGAPYHLKWFGGPPTQWFLQVVDCHRGT
jgi:beta-galactosidase GanA